MQPYKDYKIKFFWKNDAAILLLIPFVPQGKDLVIVGAGPVGLIAAVFYAQARGTAEGIVILDGSPFVTNCPAISTGLIGRHLSPLEGAPQSLPGKETKLTTAFKSSGTPGFITANLDRLSPHTLEWTRLFLKHTQESPHQALRRVKDVYELGKSSMHSWQTLALSMPELFVGTDFRMGEEEMLRVYNDPILLDGVVTRFLPIV